LQHHTRTPRFVAFADRFEAIPGQYNIATRCGPTVQRILALTEVAQVGNSADRHTTRMTKTDISTWAVVDRRPAEREQRTFLTLNQLRPRRYVMNSESSDTESVVRNHLQAFLEQKGVAAIVNDYDDNARFISEAQIYRGKQEIHGFFTGFIDALPAGGIDNFTLRSLRVDGDVAYITWSVGGDIPLGTDTFVVNNGKIVSQTFAMYAVPAQEISM
jgi:ketosteroid isomerase-like protein